MINLKAVEKQLAGILVNYFIMISFLLFSVSTSNAQLNFKQEQNNIQTLSKLSTEKIHLHIDRSIFSPGEDLWFKAYLFEGTTHEVACTSNSLHVELISPSGEITDSLTVYLNEGIGFGNFFLDKEKYRDGTYQIRAYTNFMRNFGDDLFFTKNILIKEFIEGAKQSTRMVKSGIDVRFFPEGGNFVLGVNNKVAFKTTNKAGKSENVKLLLFDEKDKLLQKTSSIHKGMGFFNLIPETNKRYYVLVESPNSEQKKYYLPETISGHSILVGDQFNNNLSCQINTSPEKVKDQKLKYTIQTRGILTLEIEVIIDKAQKDIRIDKTQLPEGISCITLYNENDIPVCERLIFNQLFQKVQIAVRPDKSVYEPKEEVSLKIVTTDETGNPVPANLSLAVVDQYINQTEKKLELQSPGIVSSLLLNADLRGQIENPEFYFQNFDIKKHFKLDLLLLTHGWRKYVWKEIVKQDNLKLDFDYEQGFTYSGTATNLIFNKPLKNTKVSISTVEDGISLQEKRTDENGNFSFESIYAQDTSVLIFQAYDKRDKRKSNIELDEYSYLSPNTRPLKSPANYYHLPGLNNFAKQTEAMNRLKDSLEIKNHIDIDDVTITAKQKKIHDGHFRIYDKPDFSLEITEELRSYPDIFAILRKHAPDVMVRGSCPSVKIDFRLSNGHPYFLLDGLPTETGVLCYLIPSGIDKIEIISGGRAAFVARNPSVNGILAVYRKKGEEQFPAYYSGIEKIRAKGYYRAREFYSPNYDIPQEGFTGTDIRNTLFWQPVVTTGEDGIATVSFFNSDETTNYNINVQGIGLKGGIGESNSEYNVAQKNIMP